MNGDTSFSQVLGKNGESKKISYTLHMNREGKIQLPACKARFVDLDKYSGEIYSDSPVVYVGVPVSEEENNQPEGEDKQQGKEDNPDNEENRPSGVQREGKEEDYRKTPGFDSISSIMGILGIIFVLKKKTQE